MGWNGSGTCVAIVRDWAISESHLFWLQYMHHGFSVRALFQLCSALQCDWNRDWLQNEILCGTLPNTADTNIFTPIYKSVRKDGSKSTSDFQCKLVLKPNCLVFVFITAFFITEMYVCIYAWMYVGRYVCMYACIYVINIPGRDLAAAALLVKLLKSRTHPRGG